MPETDTADVVKTESIKPIETEKVAVVNESKEKANNGGKEEKKSKGLNASELADRLESINSSISSKPPMSYAASLLKNLPPLSKAPVSASVPVPVYNAVTAQSNPTRDSKSPSPTPVVQHQPPTTAQSTKSEDTVSEIEEEIEEDIPYDDDFTALTADKDGTDTEAEADDSELEFSDTDLALPDSKDDDHF